MIERKTVGEPYVYKGFTIIATHLGPDLLGYIDGEELPHFYLSLGAVRRAGSRNVDLKIKEQEEKKGERRRTSR